ncbi:MAG: hypothetical protein M1838_001103 [Thelocarpon superellum]|nr:MAG: hypothetical protein M1838_001103 [Thelocarpon superellum]
MVGITSSSSGASAPPGPSSSVDDLKLPKNRSTGNLLSKGVPSAAVDRVRVRFSFDASSAIDYEAMTRSPIMAEHEHGLGASGLRRIRQQPAVRGPSGGALDSAFAPVELPARSSSMIFDLPSSRQLSDASSGPASPMLNLGEDLSRFPSESLHSFSFAHQTDDSIHIRQNILKRSVDFLRDRLGWARANPALASAQAKLDGDQELQGALDLLSRANLVGRPRANLPGLGIVEGPLTGPAHVHEDKNVFEKDFTSRAESPADLDSLPPTDKITPTAEAEVEAVGVTRPSAATETEPCDDARVIEHSRDSLGPASAGTSRTATSESQSTALTSPPLTRPSSLKRTMTDTGPLSLQNKLMEALAQPYIAGEALEVRPTRKDPIIPRPSQSGLARPGLHSAAVHGHPSRWAPAAQAIFTTEATAPWTILAANDLACLVFGVTKAEVRKIGILEVVQEERRSWLEAKLRLPGADATARARQPYSQSQRASPSSTASPWSGTGTGTGVTARLLSKPSWRDRRAQTDDGSGGNMIKTKAVKRANHVSNKSRGVLLCGDVVPIQKRNGAVGSASLWVKEKRSCLIWVLEEITEDVALVRVNDAAHVVEVEGACATIWGVPSFGPQTELHRLMPHLPRVASTGGVDYPELERWRYFTTRITDRLAIPATVDRAREPDTLRVSSFPHIAGMMVLSASTLEITSSNSVFSAALFGQAKPDGLSITHLIPGFDELLRILTEEDDVRLVDGIVIPEHSFRRARALQALRQGSPDVVASFLNPTGLPARHRDGSEIRVDVQMRVVKSDSFVPDVDESVIEEAAEEEGEPDAANGLRRNGLALTELVYALWITYSRQLHALGSADDATPTPLSAHDAPPHQPSPGQTQRGLSEDEDDDGVDPVAVPAPPLTEQIADATAHTIASPPLTQVRASAGTATIDGRDGSASPELDKKKSITDFVILEEMGQGAYGQVKLVRYKRNMSRKMVLKYVTKRRILVDTWTRDRRLGTVPLEIHVLDYLRRDGLRHPNIVEMSDFFEDDQNYYIEMLPHGLPGMDLFDYIELRVNMEEAECRSIFKQVAAAIFHLHAKALVVHRDIKDENVVLDGEGNIKLIDFGSAAYIKNGPFDVFVGTIDYAAPEVLAGKSYRGKEQDVWALGILLYTIVYKENPFYSIDEIMDHDLRVPYIMSPSSIDLIRLMLNRDVDQRIPIAQVLDHPWCTGEADGVAGPPDAHAHAAPLPDVADLASVATAASTVMDL